MKPQAGRKASFRLLATTHNWKLLVDLGRQMKFPVHIARTSLRRDLVLTSDSTKQVVLLELTVPSKDQMEEAHERKKAKYFELIEAWFTPDAEAASFRRPCLPMVLYTPDAKCTAHAVHSLFRRLPYFVHELRAIRQIVRKSRKSG